MWNQTDLGLMYISPEQEDQILWLEYQAFRVEQERGK